jgi:hypothetical protein
MVASVALDAQGMGQSFTLTEAPQGLYSRFRADIHRISMRGSYMGAPLSISIGPFAMSIDLPATTAREVGPGASAEFAVAIDGASWLKNAHFEAASRDLSGSIEVETGDDNPTIANAIAAAIPASFTLADSSVE